MENKIKELEMELSQKDAIVNKITKEGENDKKELERLKFSEKVLKEQHQEELSKLQSNFEKKLEITINQKTSEIQELQQKHDVRAQTLLDEKTRDGKVSFN
jgi:CRISPR/Cas system-associated endonuclease/helicase Cas3